MFNLVGHTLGQYRLEELIHEGDNDVYKAFQPGMNRHVAVKVLDPALAGYPNFNYQFQQDMQFFASLEHPNLLAIYDFGEQSGWLYQVTRYIESGTLRDRLAQATSPYTVQQAQQLIEPIAAALDYLHSKGAVHRNLRPSNILIDTHGQPLLSDFGSSQGLDLGRRKDVYLSSEQREGRPVDRRTDVYALGVLLYEMLVGEPPALDAVTAPRLKRPDLPLAVEQVIITAMAQFPDQRYESTRDVSHALEQAASAQPATPAPPPPAAAPATVPAQTGGRLNWFLIGGMVVILLLLASLVCAGFSLFSGSDGEPPASEEPPPIEQPIEPPAEDQPVEPPPVEQPVEPPPEEQPEQLPEEPAEEAQPDEGETAPE
jgi:serine/threonine-protein kinase